MFGLISGVRFPHQNKLKYSYLCTSANNLPGTPANVRPSSTFPLLSAEKLGRPKCTQLQLKTKTRFTYAFLYLSHYSQPSRDPRKSATVHDRTCPRVH